MYPDFSYAGTAHRFPLKAGWTSRRGTGLAADLSGEALTKPEGSAKA